MPLELAATVMPAGNAQTGGDFWLCLERSDGATFLVVGDVSGHGEEASDKASTVRDAIEAFAETAETPCELLEQANDTVRKQLRDEPLFVTAVAVLFEPDARQLSWAYAGHLPPHRLDTGTPLDGARPGIPLGVDEAVNCTTTSQANVAPGSGLLLYTDGLEDATGPGGDRFGVARVAHALADAAGQSADATVDSLRRAVCEFAGRELPDDVCIVAVRVIA